MYLATLAARLRETGRPVCRKIAAELEVCAGDSFNLHLRRAQLSLEDAKKVAGALAQLPSDGPKLRSFSVSYNPTLGDDGINILLSALPSGVTDLGLVGCALTDESGRTLVKWAQEAAGLRMICVEDNHYTVQMRDEIAKIGILSANVQVYV